MTRTRPLRPRWPIDPTPDYYSHVSLRLYPSPWASRMGRDGLGQGHRSPSAAGLQREDDPRGQGRPRHDGLRRRQRAAT